MAMKTLVPSARIVADTLGRAPETALTVSDILGNFFAEIGLESLNEVTYKPSISSALALMGFTVALIFIFSCSGLACSLFCNCLSKVC
jgi:hypothetical protein